MFAIRLPLPSSRELKPWLYAIPDNTDEAGEMLQVFLEEERHRLSALGVDHPSRTGPGVRTGHVRVATSRRR